MKFTFNWLKEFVKVTAGPQELAKLLTMAGLEVESLAPQREAETNAEDWLFEIAVTPNRGDSLGIAGIAREVAALTGGKLLSMPSSPAKKDSTISKRISLIIEDPRLCPRYSARIVDEVAISAAPTWLRYRIESCGIRAINNVVDLTNYVMLETGQPLHAFDLDRLPAKEIVVKPAGEVKKFTTLDGVERELTAEDLLICAGETPVALAGVMGGMDSEVTDSTRSLLLESANFAPTSIRRTAKRLALHSEASHRFERGVDPEGTIAALDRAVYLLIEHAGAKAMAGVADRYPTTLPWARCSGGKHDSRLGWERKLRSLLAGEGMTEVINLPFTSEALNRTFVGPWESAPATVAVLNPLAKENAEMRGSLLPGLLDNLRLNLAYQAQSFWVYHLGKVFRSIAGGESTERQCVAGLLYGPRPRYGLRVSEESPVGFLDCKGLVEAVLELSRVRELVSWSATAPGVLHRGRSASLRYGGTELGYLGQLHPDVCDQLAVPPVLLFELDFEKLLQYAPRRITTRALPRFPAVERDVAIVVDRDFASQQIVSWIQNLGEALIEHVEVFDQYVGAPIPETKKSLAYKISYRAEDRTLTDSEINELHQSLVDRLGKTFGAERRS